MNQSRRDFIKKASILSGAAGLINMLPSSIVKAMTINAAPGTTFYDAEHIVFLMQENRSFDHIFGKLRGVRGFNDPRAKFLPDNNAVWVQKDNQTNHYSPFHLDLNKTKITWQGGLAHSWSDQIGARNGGKYDKWIPSKTSMAMGYYERTDLPFYYALADAFTICDHYFCASLTGTTPNRLFFWTGNNRPGPNGTSSPIVVSNSQAETRTNTFVDWAAFPELLEDNGVSWKVYQNELWAAVISNDGWLGNYGDNALEYIKRYNVFLAPYFQKNGRGTLSAAQVTAKYNNLSQRDKDFVDKMFGNNVGDSNYMKLSPFTFTNDLGQQQTVNIPRGDIFYQFRQDVNNGTLPTVSWLVAPQEFSDHTSAPLYGTWYVSEALDILTQNPDLWKKTIFILNYDENDGYFDHLPPFVPPNPSDITTGKVTTDIDPSSDYHGSYNSPIGLGYRVPCIVASPWSKGGYVNSQVFDHTSTLMFLENFLQKKTGKPFLSPNISSWRRNICGDMTSIFRPYNGETIPLPKFENKNTVITNIQDANNKPKQASPSPLSANDIVQINACIPFSQSVPNTMPQQEVGTKPACALPYILLADTALSTDKSTLNLTLVATKLNNEVGAAFNVYTPTSYNGNAGNTWAYAVSAGNSLTDNLAVNKFPNNQYNICVHGPNGFFRHFIGDNTEPNINVTCTYEQNPVSQLLIGNVILNIGNNDLNLLSFTITDNAYGTSPQTVTVAANGNSAITMNLFNSSNWYDFTLTLSGNTVFSKQYAGHVETGNVSTTDPLMGRAAPVTTLPINLLSFDVFKKGHQVLIEWGTALEQNNKGFYVQRSSDAKSWSNLMFIPSKAINGNSAQQLFYSEYDTNPLAGINFYRLEQVDIDYKSTLYYVKSVDFRDDVYQMKIYPNPASSIVHIEGVDWNQVREVSLIDLSGKIVSGLRDARNGIMVDKIPAGIYFIKILFQNSKVISNKIVVQK